MDLSVLSPFLVLGMGGLLAFAVASRREARPRDRALVAMAWGPGLAAGLLSLTSFAGLVLGLGSPGRGVLLGVLVAPIPVAWWLIRGVRGARDGRRQIDGAGPGTVGIGTFALASFAVAYAWTFGRWLGHRPLGSFDGMAIWTYRALQWYRSGDAFPAVLGALLESKPGYPLLLPGLIASEFTLWGGETTVIPVATGWLFVVTVAAATMLAVIRHAPVGAALAATSLLLSTPVVWRWAFAQSADLALASLTVTAALGLVDLLDRGGRASAPAWLVGFFLGLMVWTKNEGLILALVLVVVTAIATAAGRRRLGWSRWAALALGSLPAVTATAIVKLGWAVGGEAQRYLDAGLWARLIDPTRWREIAVAFLSRPVPLSGDTLWGGTLVLLVALAALAVLRPGRGRRTETALLYGVPVVVAVAIDAAIYLITPEPLEWHLRTSLDRLLLQLLPLAVVAVFVGAFGETPEPVAAEERSPAPSAPAEVP